MTPPWVLDMTGKDAPTPYGARTLASIVLIFYHPSLSYPEATVRTYFCRSVSQPQKRRWLWPRDFWPRKAFLDLFVVSGLGETGSAPNGNPLVIFARGQEGIGQDGVCARRRPPCDLGQRGGGGSSAACPGRNRPDITFQSAPFEARRVGSRNGRVVVP